MLFLFSGTEGVHCIRSILAYYNTSNIKMYHITGYNLQNDPITATVDTIANRP